MNTVEFMHMARFEDIEISAMFHIYALKTAAKLFPQNKPIKTVSFPYTDLESS
jgi:hypothetical protein